jgi:mono/diheme cytochrome c family protein
MKRAMVLAAAAAVFALSTAKADVDAKAARTFKGKCSSCHGVAGKGDTDMGKKLKTPDFSAAAVQKRLTDEGIKSVIKDGKVGTKTIEDHAFGAKVGDQLGGLVAVVRSFGAK